MYSEKHVFLRKQGGTYLAYDCTEVTTVALENQGHDLKYHSYGIKYRSTIFRFLLQYFIFEKPVKNLWEVIRNVNCARKKKPRLQNFSTTHNLLPYMNRKSFRARIEKYETLKIPVEKGVKFSSRDQHKIRNTPNET